MIIATPRELGPHKILQNQVLYGFGDNDAVRVRGHGAAVVNNHIIDAEPSKAPHKDAIQLIPPSMPGQPNDQYLGGMLLGVKVARNTLFSVGSMQGVFASDGLFEELEIVNNTIDTGSAHEITIGGLLSGRIAYNSRDDKTPCKVLLPPLRLGGNPHGHGNVWVIGMEDFEYKSIDYGHDGECPAYVTDQRTERPSEIREGDIYLTGLNLAELRHETRKKIHNSTAALAQYTQDLAVRMGDVV